jgi:transglutaminase-like putative cysteine protease
MSFFSDLWKIWNTPKPSAKDNDIELVACEASLAQMKAERDSYAKQLSDNASYVSSLESTIVDLTHAIGSASNTVVHPKEKFWNEKYPVSDDVTWACRYERLSDDTYETFSVDPRIFFTEQPNPLLSSLAKSVLVPLKAKLKREPTNDEKALACLQFIRKNVSYWSDKKVYGLEEVWLFWWETWKIKKGDCEDGSILLANLMLACGIPYWRIRLNAGDVNGGGHCYTTYCRETDDEFVVLDWCYWPTDKPVSERKLHRDEKNYDNPSLNWGIWWSFHTRSVFRKIVFLSNE